MRGAIVTEADSGRPHGSDKSDRTSSVYRQVLLSYLRIWQLSWELIAFKACICQGFIESILPLQFNLSCFIAEPQVAKLQFIIRRYTF